MSLLHDAPLIGYPPRMADTERLPDAKELELIATIRRRCDVIAGAKTLEESDHDDLSSLAELYELLRNDLRALDEHDGRRSPTHVQLAEVLRCVALLPRLTPVAPAPTLELPEDATKDELRALYLAHAEKLRLVAEANAGQVRAWAARHDALVESVRVAIA